MRGFDIPQTSNLIVFEFALELLHVVNDWQCGGDHSRKSNVATNSSSSRLILRIDSEPALKSAIGRRPLRRIESGSYLTVSSLPETIAAWTNDLAVARDFKNGVPPDGV